MAHSTTIDGTSYEITGGRTLVDGTGYEIKSGKTLVGSTAYEVEFEPPTAIVTIKGEGTQSDYSKVTINDVTYDGDDSAQVAVPIGTEVVCWIENISTNTTDIFGDYMSFVKVNGDVVAYAEKQSEASYTHVITGDTNITMDNGTSNNYYHYGYIDITTA